eukprot:GFYU01008410.1.p1 GENE.GFYU01008410.1~~GFYU01008410.1.p1  ORF type:complete len:528 (-),score=150.33 GFYU01008410.1:230-1813(-)
MGRRTSALLSVAVAVTAAATTPVAMGAEYHSAHTEDPVLFAMQTVDGNASGTYNALMKDVNNDGLQDIVSMAYSGTSAGAKEGEVYWYQNLGCDGQVCNPKWKKRLLSKKPHVVYGDWLDVDGDGRDDLVFNSNFEVPPEGTQAEGGFWWARQPETFEDDKEWDTHYIGKVVGNHRVVTGDFDGDGKAKEALAVPLFSPGEGPFYGPVTIRLFYLDSGDDIFKLWRSFDATAGVYNSVHDAKAVANTDSGVGVHVMLAAHEGVELMRLQRGDGHWHAAFTTLAQSVEGDRDRMLSYRDVGVRRLTDTCDANPKGMRGITALSQTPLDDVASTEFMAAIEYTESSSMLEGQPWHGDIVTVYTAAQGRTLADKGIERHVLERRYAGGHAVAVADMNGDGCEDVLAGFREYPTSFMLYLCERSHQRDPVTGTVSLKTSFKKQVISERGANAITVHDFNRDGKPDVLTNGFGMAGDTYIQIWYNVGTAQDQLRRMGPVADTSTVDEPATRDGGVSGFVATLFRTLTGRGSE